MSSQDDLDNTRLTGFVDQIKVVIWILLTMYVFDVCCSSMSIMYLLLYGVGFRGVSRAQLVRVSGHVFACVCVSMY